MRRNQSDAGGKNKGREQGAGGIESKLRPYKEHVQPNLQQPLQYGRWNGELLPPPPPQPFDLVQQRYTVAISTLSSMFPMLQGHALTVMLRRLLLAALPAEEPFGVPAKLRGVQLPILVAALDAVRLCPTTECLGVLHKIRDAYLAGEQLTNIVVRRGVLAALARRSGCFSVCVQYVVFHCLSSSYTHILFLHIAGYTLTRPEGVPPSPGPCA